MFLLFPRRKVNVMVMGVVAMFHYKWASLVMSSSQWGKKKTNYLVFKVVMWDFNDLGSVSAAATVISEQVI